MTLEELNSIPLHDQGVESVKIDFAEESVSLSIEFFHETATEPEFFTLMFGSVKSLSWEGSSFTEFYSVQIITMNIGKRSDKKYDAELIISSEGPSRTSILKFDFESVRKVPASSSGTV